MSIKELQRRHETGEQLNKPARQGIARELKRVCKYKKCGASLAFERKDKEYCDLSHRKKEASRVRAANKKKKTAYNLRHGLGRKTIRKNIKMSHQTDYLPADTPVIYLDYKEPLKPIEPENGVGYYGTIATTEDRNYIQCHICGNLFKSLGGHLRNHKLTSKAYKGKYGLGVMTALVGESTRHNLQKSAVSGYQPGELPEHLKEYNRKVQAGEIDHGKAMKGRTGLRLEKRNKLGLCPDQVLERIRECAEALGHTPSEDEFKKHFGFKYYGAIVFQHGSYLNAVAKLGMKSAKELKEHTSEALIENIQEFYEREGRIPMTSDFNRGLLGAARGTYIARFGSLNNARLEAGLNAVLPMPFGQVIEVDAQQYLDYKNGHSTPFTEESRKKRLQRKDSREKYEELKLN